MTSGPQGPFDRRLLEQSAFGLTSFKSALPADAVLSLAREVVTRLAGRARELEARDIAAPSRAEIDALCAALTSTDSEAGARFIAGIRREGAALDVIYLAYLASAARRLGEWWDEDRVPSALVTIASSRIYAIMRGLRHVLDLPLDRRRAGRSAPRSSPPCRARPIRWASPWPPTCSAARAGRSSCWSVWAMTS
ncbi:hypothetical protein FAZ78_20330 [Cereibacter changlensis]|uniref:Uncharacterized protein n=1 Tax=Cereibacter changlensis TaxID=402884 RepID=A0A4U0YQQ3_9RHOB|nr:hypothetical protein [Cereibacter changlensis]TKA94802.1 hypothetical protein FAZ78_20330 [Cereibacter changlensis]